MDIDLHGLFFATEVTEKKIFSRKKAQKGTNNF
jgi:hypothetical protein